MKLLILALLLLTTGIANAAPNDIYAVDFRNYNYRPSCQRLAASSAEVEQWQLSGSGESVVATNGVFQSNNPDDPLDFKITSVTYGDMSSNPVAIVTTVCNSGGSGDFSEGFVYSMVKSQPKLLAIIQGGDRANGGIHSATITNGLLRVERFGTNGGACCPEWIQTTDYQWRDGQLVQAGPERREKFVEPIISAK